MKRNNYALKWLYTGLSLFLAVGVFGQNQTVTSSLDGVGADLRSAVANASAGDTIFFSPLTDGVPQILINGEIEIDKALVFIGNGSATTTVGANTNSRIFNIQSADSVVISGMGFDQGSTDSTGGAIWANMTSLRIDDGDFTTCTADSSGGAIHANGIDISVEITNSSFTGNIATGELATNGGGAIYMDGGDLFVAQTSFTQNNAITGSGSGGAIFLGDGAGFRADTCDFLTNVSARAGGAIEDRSGNITTAILNGNTFTSNTTGATPGNGGAIHITGPGNMTINNGSFSGNLASREGGAVWNGSGSMIISGADISGNIASGDAADDGGGAVFNNGGILTIQNCTIDGNTANGLAGSGGGVFNHTNGQMSIVNTIITNNSAVRAGGGIEDNSGATNDLTLIGVTLDSNSTSASPGNGGGLHITGAGNVNITDGTVRANTASAEGGGLWNGTGIMIVDGTDISNNTASGADSDQGGGGIYNLGGTVSVMNARIVGNVADGAAGSGGGILNDMGASLDVSSTLIKNNTAVRAGGGIEDNSRSGTSVVLSMVSLDSNTTAAAPGNGGGLHITGDGDASITGGTVIGNTAAAEGGGLWNGAGTMVVDGTTISGNTASGPAADQGGGGIYNLSGTLTVQNGTMITRNVADGTAGSGGGILNDVGGTLNVLGSTISQNTAVRAGGAIEDVSGDATLMTITDATMASNEAGAAPGNGGAIHITGAGNATITGSSFLGNLAAAEGGALWNGAGNMTVDNCTITGNIASGDGADQGGGGIYNLSGSLEVQNGTIISENIADGTSGSGGGILNDAGASLSVTASTINDNTSNRAGGGIEDNSGDVTTVTLNNVILEGNSTGDAPGNGGAIHISGPGNMTITGGNISNNFAFAEGGGVWNGAGLMTIEGTRIDSNEAAGPGSDQGGGGVFNFRGTVEINNATIADNAATGTAGSGGGILNDTLCTLTVTNSTILRNSAMRAGGGIEDNSRGSTVVNIMNTSLDSNTTGNAPGNGGAIHITGNGSMNITGGRANGNFAFAEGGGFWNGAGIMMVDGVSFDGNEAAGDDATQGGGALFNLAGTMILKNATITNNTATGVSGSGGGIFADLGSTLQVDSSSFDGNVSNRAGGAIEDNSRETTVMVINESDFTNNSTGAAPGNGGAIHISGAGDAIITGGTYERNEAAREGGAIWNGGGEMVVTGVTVAFNSANGPAENDGGGGFFNNGGILVINNSTINTNTATEMLGSGGGIHNNGGVLDLNFSTVSGNISNYYGGGIYNFGDMEILASTITNNGTSFNGGGIAQNEAASTVNFSSSILAGNSTTGGGEDFINPQGTFTSDGYNLVGLDENGLFPVQTTDIVGTPAVPQDPMLEALADNGGPTFTHAIICGSNALNNGDPAITDNDQRDLPVFGAARDIGSFERQSICTGINEQTGQENIAAVYPNPISGEKLNIKVPSNAEVKAFSVVEMASGKTLQVGTLNAGNNSISLSQYNAGAYAVKIVFNTHTEVHRIIKAK